MDHHVLHTPRALLRPWRVDDAGLLLPFFQHPHTRRYLLDGAVVDHAWMTSEIAASMERFARGVPGLWMAAAVEDGDLLGMCGFRPDHEPPVLELIYAVAEQHTGKGLATQLATAVMAYARRMGQQDLHAAVDVVNVASVAVLHKLGFVETHRSPGAFGEMMHLVCKQR